MTQGSGPFQGAYVNFTDTLRFSEEVTDPAVAAFHQQLTEQHQPAGYKDDSANMNIVIDGVMYSGERLRSMADTLNFARGAKLFPKSVSNPFDAKIIVGDFQLFEQLRVLWPEEEPVAPDAWKALFVEISRKFYHRDEAVMVARKDKEVAARMYNFMDTVNHEKNVYDSAGKATFGLDHEGKMKLTTENIFSTIEDSVEYTISDAMAPLRLISRNLDALLGQNAHLGNALNYQSQQTSAQNSVMTASVETLTANVGATLNNNIETLNNFNEMQHKLSIALNKLTNQVERNESLGSSLSGTLHTQVDHHSQLTESLHDQLTTAKEIVNSLNQATPTEDSITSLSQLTANLSLHIEKVVSTAVTDAVTKHTAALTDHFLDQQNKMFNTLKQDFFDSMLIHPGVTYEMLLAAAPRMTHPVPRKPRVMARRIGGFSFNSRSKIQKSTSTRK